MNDLKVSRYISYILRHHPEDINLKMDVEGWVQVDELISGINHKKKINITREDLDRIVKNDEKGRYVYTGNKEFIRACQGHSIEGLKITFEKRMPPDILYHGTSSEYYNLIKKEGIKSQTRQYVHLSQDVETARNVGKRHGYPVIILIDAKKMYEDGEIFYISENGVWLTSFVESKYFIETIN